jgi:hypothetical protein
MVSHSMSPAEIQGVYFVVSQSVRSRRNTGCIFDGVPEHGSSTFSCEPLTYVTGLNGVAPQKTLIFVTCRSTCCLCFRTLAILRACGFEPPVKWNWPDVQPTDSRSFRFLPLRASFVTRRHSSGVYRLVDQHSQSLMAWSQDRVCCYHGNTTMSSSPCGLTRRCRRYPDDGLQTLRCEVGISHSWGSLRRYVPCQRKRYLDVAGLNMTPLTCSVQQWHLTWRNVILIFSYNW